MSSDTASAFGSRLKFLRHLKNMTQKELAAKVGLSVKHLARIEHCASSPSFQVIVRLGQALDTSCFNLFLNEIHSDVPIRTEGPRNHREACMPPNLQLCLTVRLGAWLLDGDQGQHVWSECLYTMLGYAPGSVKPSVKRFMKHVAPQHREETARFFLEAAKFKKQDELLITVNSRHKEQRTIQLSVETFFKDGETSARVLIIVQDVSECFALNQALTCNHEELEAYVRDKSWELAENVESLKREAAQREKAEQEWRVYERMVHSSLDALVYIDAEGLIRAVNRQYAARLGLQRRQIVGRDYLQVMTAAWGEKFVQEQIAPRIRQTLRRNIPRPLLLWLDYPSLGRRYVRASFSPCLDKNKVAGVVVTVHDLTVLEQAREELEIYKHAVNSSRTSMAMADKNHMLVKVNPAFLEMWGYATADECVGRHASEFHYFTETERDVIADVRRAGVWTGRLVCIRKDGGRFTADVAASAMRDCKGNIVGYMASFTQVPDATGTEQR